MAPRRRTELSILTSPSVRGCGALTIGIVKVVGFFQWPSGLQAVFETSVFGNVKCNLELWIAMTCYLLYSTLCYIIHKNQ